MFIKKYENVSIKFDTKHQITKWSKKLGFIPKIGKLININWKLLKSTTFRTLYIKVKCDDCGKIHERRIRDLNENKNLHFCKTCGKKGKKNGMFGKPVSKNTKDGLKKFHKKYGNPFTWESSKKKIKEADVWSKISKKNTGKKRTEETKKLQSKSALLAFKEGRRVPCKRWGKTIIKQYKGIDYQSSYELKFLKFVESKGLFEYIERGPVIEYFENQNESHSYFVDYKLKNTDIVFEIKSTFIWKKNLEKNLLKKEATEKLFNFILVIDNRFNKVKKILKEYEKKI